MRNTLTSARKAQDADTQASSLLPRLFDGFDEEQRITVLHIGPALPETVEFFSGFRCRLYFADLFEELPLAIPEDVEASPDQYLETHFRDALALPPDARLDACLFWDLFNFLDTTAVGALMNALRPHMHKHSRGHGFVMHNNRAPQTRHLYGIEDSATLRQRRRDQALAGYAPLGQGQLKTALSCFTVERSLLLPDKRLELLLQARL